MAMKADVAVLEVPAVREAVVDGVKAKRQADAAGLTFAERFTDAGGHWTYLISPGYKARGVESTSTPEFYAGFQCMVMDAMTRRVGGKVEFTKEDAAACERVIKNGRKDSDAEDVVVWDQWKAHISGYVGMFRDYAESAQDPEGFVERRTATKNAKASTKGARKGARAAGKGASKGGAFNIGEGADPCEVLDAWLDLFEDRNERATARVEAALEEFGYKRGK